MALVINLANPADGQQNVVIDAKIELEFDKAIDPFTVAHGLSLYTPTDSQWTGPDLSVLDTEYRDVLDITQEYSYFQYNWTLEDNSGGTPNAKLVITPQATLLPDRDYYFVVYPGDDVSRYLSAETASTPVYVPFDVAEVSPVTVDIASSYAGTTAGTYTLLVDALHSDPNTDFDISYSFEGGASTTVTVTHSTDEQFELDMGDLTITLNRGTLAQFDTITIDVFPAEGTANVLKNKFTTTHLEQGSVPSSTRVDTVVPTVQQGGEEISGGSFKLVNTIPADLSVNNLKVNPITLKFSETLDTNQDLASKITIYRTDLDTGARRQVNYYYKISGASVKLYLTTLVS